MYINCLVDEEWIHSAQKGLSHMVSKLILSKLQDIPYPEEQGEDPELRVPIISPLPEVIPFPGIDLCGFRLDVIGQAIYGDLNIL